MVNKDLLLSSSVYSKSESFKIYALTKILHLKFFFLITSYGDNIFAERILYLLISIFKNFGSVPLSPVFSYGLH